MHLRNTARINSIDLLRCVDLSSRGIDACGDLLTSPSSEAVRGHNGCSSLRFSHSPGLFSHSNDAFLSLSWLAVGEGAAGHAGLWEQSGDDTVTHLRADTVLLWCLWLELSAEALVPEPTLDEDTGNEEMGRLSCVITGTQTGECVFVYACVCVSVFETDRRTDRRSPCCMHDLSHSSRSNTV